MKTCRTVVMLGVIAALALSGAAYANVIDQSFDGPEFVAGTRLDGTGVGDSSTSAGKWISGAAPGAEVEDVQSYSPGQSLESHRVAGGYDTGRFVGYVDTGNGVGAGTVVASFRAQRGSAGWTNPGTEYYGAGATFIVGTVGGIVSLDTAIGDYAIGLKIHSDNNLYVRDGNVNVLAVELLDPPGGIGGPICDWHAYKMVIDLDNSTYDVYLSMDATEAGYSLIYTGATFNPVFLRNAALVTEINAVATDSHYYTTDRGPVWFDDIVVTPEPTTMLLIGMGGLLGWRRRK